jgi:hypothetical protein
MNSVMWELLTGEEPYRNMKIFQIPQYVMDGKRPALPKVNCVCEQYLKKQNREPAYVKLISQAWAQNPEDRPTMAQLALSLHEI